MDYKLIITERAEELLDELLYYLLFKLKRLQGVTDLIMKAIGGDLIAFFVP